MVLPAGVDKSTIDNRRSTEADGTEALLYSLNFELELPLGALGVERRWVFFCSSVLLFSLIFFLFCFSTSFFVLLNSFFRSFEFFVLRSSFFEFVRVRPIPRLASTTRSKRKFPLTLRSDLLDPVGTLLLPRPCPCSHEQRVAPLRAHGNDNQFQPTCSCAGYPSLRSVLLKKPGCEGGAIRFFRFQNG
eukprot:scaffold1954_cov268-Pinguiococcus_pyrenoidosus.AAC.313